MRQANCPEQWGAGGELEARGGERSAGRGGNIMARVDRLARLGQESWGEFKHYLHYMQFLNQGN